MKVTLHVRPSWVCLKLRSQDASPSFRTKSLARERFIYVANKETKMKSQRQKDEKNKKCMDSGHTEKQIKIRNKERKKREEKRKQKEEREQRKIIQRYQRKESEKREKGKKEEIQMRRQMKPRQR